MAYPVRKLPRLAASLAGLATLCACATTAPSGAPHDAFVADALKLCSGVSISNAPAAASTREIIGYEPFAKVRGVVIARAPVEACVSSAYGPRSGGAGAVHEGLDLYTGSPRAVFAGGDGRVESIREQRGYGLVIEIRHANGVSTRYAHLSGVAPGVRTGGSVKAGEVIARTGRTGNATAIHLHYEILVDGSPKDPLRVGD